MKKTWKRLCTGFLALATVVTALPTTPVHAESKKYWTESKERVGIVEKVMNDGSIGSTFNEGHLTVEGEDAYCIDINTDWSYVKKKYKLNVTNFLCSERSLTCYFYCILLDVFKILFLIFIWRQISTMTVNAYGIIKCFDVFKNQFMCMCIIKDFKPVDPFSLQKCMERFYTGVIPWICFL